MIIPPRVTAGAILVALIAFASPSVAQPLPSGYAADVTRRTDFKDLGPAAGALPVHIAVTLNYQREAELASLVALQANRHSPLYHHYLTSAQFNNYFAPSPAAQALVITSLRKAGFMITGVAPNRTLVDAVGTAATADRYFNTRIDSVYQLRGGYRYANVRPATMPAQLRGIVA
ncbi:MAG: protease pro-enzyme activation domain-containing protein, partial [Candidatus Eremiobacteraeota bacterium]|nr:protease pro-enzyme activation domain-containing protein [Candidatus Eremiobacteraeota bacterium]